MTTRDIYGRGFAFPLTPRGSFDAVEGAESVAQGLRQILLTSPGERIGRPTFGVGLRRFLFAPNTVTTRTLVKKAVSEALRRDAPRVKVSGVNITTDRAEPTLLRIDIRYTLIGETVPRNLVYPFYLDDRG